MGIKTKMLSGFVVIGLLLFLSGAITLFELKSMGNSVQGLLNDNLQSIEVSKQMLRAQNTIGQGVLLAINGKTKEAKVAIAEGETRFLQFQGAAYKNLTVEGEGQYVKHIDNSFILLKRQVDSVLYSANPRSIEWYFTNFVPYQERLTRAIDGLIKVNQVAITQNVKQMEEAPNRVIMPSLIAIFVGIIFVFLFNYFVNVFFITPIVRISQGVENYVKHSIPFRVKVDSKDELERLNNSVEKLISQNISNKIDD